MRQWLLAILLSITSVFAHAVDVGGQAPRFKMPGPRGEVALSKSQGQVVLVNFWASWCGPCRKELPELESLYQQHKDKGFTIIGVNIDKERKNADQFIAKFRLSYPIGYDPESKIISAYKGKAMPTSYLLGRDGKVKKIFLGYTKKKFPKMRDDILAEIAR